jgi:WD repeat-containing protein 68
MAWRRRPEGRLQVALGSFIEEYANQFHLVQIDTNTATCTKFAQFDHPYPATKILWAPSKYNLNSSTTADIFATSGDYLRIWTLTTENQVMMKGVLNNNKHAGMN